MTTQTYAMIQSGSNVVDNILIADSTDDFATLYPGETLQAVASGVFCMPGMFYNSADSLYYIDAAFTTTTPPADYNDTTTS